MGFSDEYIYNGTTIKFYNVTHAVGNQSPNLVDDVKLVQYLLKIFYEKGTIHNQKYTKLNGEMIVDGLCGPITIKWILKFQSDVNKAKPNSCTTDGCVNHLRNHNIVTSISRTGYTIGFLNNWAKEANPEGYALLPCFVPITGPPITESS